MKHVAQYEAEFARAVGAPFARSFWKGRTALHAILRALDIGNGDEVLVPGFTCVVVANAVRLCGATPIYVDIAPGSYNVSAGSVIRNITPRTRALIVQHTFGIPADLDLLLQIAEGHNLHIIEDCAHALGSTYKGKHVGSFGKAAFFSSQWSKPYTTGLGGMAVTWDAEVAKALTKLQADCSKPSKQQLVKLCLQYRIYQAIFCPRLYWPTMKTLRILSALNICVGSSSQEELNGLYTPDMEWRMSSFQADIGRKHLSRLSLNLMHRRAIAEIYEGILTTRGWPIPAHTKYGESVFLRYPVLVSNKWGLLNLAKEAGIELGSWFESVLHPLHSSMERHGYRCGQCPVAERTSNEVVNLPLHMRLSTKEAERIAEFVCHAGQRSMEGMPALA
jgi:perosamine synthetase